MTTPTTNDRPKVDMARLVDAALAIQIEHGRRAAAVFLNNNGAGFRLTVRVLSEPARRRV